MKQMKNNLSPSFINNLFVTVILTSNFPSDLGKLEQTLHLLYKSGDKSDVSNTYKLL